MKRPKIITWDLETLPLILSGFEIYKPFLTHHNIITDFTICSGSWKLLGAPVRVSSVKHTAPRNDKDLVSELRDVLADADIVVHHNGDKFDVPVLNARLIYHGLKPLPPLRTVDTKKLAFKRFRFSCAKLDYLAQFLGLGRKIPTSYDLWLGVLNGDADALAKMRRYNKGDVVLEEKVYLKMRAFDDQHPNSNLWTGGNGCPVCGGGVLQSRGYARTRSRQYRRFQCQACGAWSRENESVISARLS